MHGLIKNCPHFSVNNLTDIFGISQVYLSSRMDIVTRSLDKKEEEETERATKLNMVKLI